MQVLFSAAVIVLVLVHRFAQIVHVNEGEGKLALFRTENNVLLTLLHSLFLSFYFIFSSIFPPPHRPYIDPSSTSYRPHIDPTLTLYRPHIYPTSTRHRPCIDLPPSTIPPPHFYCFPSSSSSYFYFFCLF